MLSLFPAPPAEFLATAARVAGERLVAAATALADLMPEDPLFERARAAATAAALGFGASLAALYEVDGALARAVEDEFLRGIGRLSLAAAPQLSIPEAARRVC
jgi:hypothetical protein